MKRKDILISLAIIVASISAFFVYSFTNSLVHGYIKLDSGDARATLKLRGNFFTGDFSISENETVLINSRITRPTSLTIFQTQDSNSLKLVSYGPWADLSRIKIKNNETKTIRLGPPLIIKPAITKNANIVDVDFLLVGQAGERYQVPTTKKTPTIKFMDENGKILASGKFSYG